jgi:hypothetical protein
MALQYFAGGSFYNIAPLYGCSLTEAKYSLWYVVAAVNSCSSLEIVYHSNHVAQPLAIAAEFKKK